MKKVHIFLMIVLSSFLVFGGSINVTSPNASSNWEIGTAHNITWTHSGCTSVNVKINIFRNSINQANFVEQLTATLSSGSKNWSIPASYTAGTYVVRVKTEDNNCVGDSPGFTISNTAATPGSMTVTNPPSPNPTWQHAITYPILWQKSGNLDPNVKIQLYNAAGTSPVRLIYFSKPNTGNQNWKVPIDIPAGNYKIKITTSDNTVSDMSDLFAIAKNPNNSVYLTIGNKHGTVTGFATPKPMNLQKTPGLLTPTATPKFIAININNAFYALNMSTPYGNNSNPLKIAITANCTSPLEYRAVVYMSNINVSNGEMFLMHDSAWKDSNIFSIIIPTSALNQVASSPLPMWYGGEIILYLRNKTTSAQTTKTCTVKFTW